MHPFLFPTYVLGAVAIPLFVLIGALLPPGLDFHKDQFAIAVFATLEALFLIGLWSTYRVSKNDSVLLTIAQWLPLLAFAAGLMRVILGNIVGY
jgi:hypothetical protein